MADLARLKALSPVQQRRAAAILGAIVADAATAPLHWIYDQPKVRALVEAGPGEFHPSSQCPFYTVATGKFSAYGDQVSITLKSVAEKKGLQRDALSEQLVVFFGPGTDFEKGRNLMAEKKYPIAAPWTNHCLRTFLETGKGDTESKDPDGLVRSIVVIAAYSGKPELLDRVSDCVTLVQTNPTAVGYAHAGARILNAVIETGGDGVAAALAQLKDPARTHKHDLDSEIVTGIEKAVKASGTPHPEAASGFGLSCGFPGSFHGMIHGVASAKDYKHAVRESILAAGDNCSRVNFIAACTAARCGLDSIPTEWIKKVDGYEQILAYVETVAKL